LEVFFMKAERRAANWLKMGGRMLSEVCSKCGSPLFEIRGEIWCPGCNKPVMTAEERRLVLEVERVNILQRVEETLINRISQLEVEVRRAKDIQGLQSSAYTLYLLLACLESLKKIKE